ncbi:MAG: prepilin-type N-terminal cleavage/methylation domain-containing protein [Proteobacteria bacterium]|nr:prepilin-type N-terminal cleavage/methylation domain-containing protein [Pseudomonadota bacterium]
MENFSTQYRRGQGGLSLIEVLITLVITSIVLAALSIGFPSMKAITLKMIEKSDYDEQFLIFLIKLEENFQLAEIENMNSGTYLDEMSFKIDHNRDGSYEQSSDRIAYRWNGSKKRVEMKRGNSYYNSILEGVTQFSWLRKGNFPLCYQMSVENLFSKTPRTVRFCKHLDNHFQDES